MQNLIDTLSKLNTVSIIVRILLSALFGAIIGYERGKHGRAAGLRTHMLVAMGSAISSIVGIYMTQVSTTGGDPTRIAAGVVSGIGFLCAGIILVKSSSNVTGLTTAAGMWATSTIGLAVGAGLYLASAAAVVILLLTLTFMTLVEAKQKRDRRFIIEVSDAALVNDLISMIREKYPSCHSFDVIQAKSNVPGRVAIAVNIMNAAGDPDVTETVRKMDGVIFIMAE